MDRKHGCRPVVPPDRRAMRMPRYRRRCAPACRPAGRQRHSRWSVRFPSSVVSDAPACFPCGTASVSPVDRSCEPTAPHDAAPTNLPCRRTLRRPACRSPAPVRPVDRESPQFHDDRQTRSGCRHRQSTCHLNLAPPARFPVQERHAR